MFSSIKISLLLSVILTVGCAAPKSDSLPSASSDTSTKSNGKPGNIGGDGSVNSNDPNAEQNNTNSTGSMPSSEEGITSSITVPSSGASCAGARLDGAGCWYAGAAGQSCTSVCANHGGVESFIINSTQCGQLVKSVGGKANATKSTNATYVPYGCYFWSVKSSIIFSNSSSQDDPNAASNTATRLCNCAN